MGGLNGGERGQQIASFFTTSPSVLVFNGSEEVSIGGSFVGEREELFFTPSFDLLVL